MVQVIVREALERRNVGRVVPQCGAKLIPLFLGPLVRRQRPVGGDAFCRHGEKRLPQGRYCWGGGGVGPQVRRRDIERGRHVQCDVMLDVKSVGVAPVVGAGPQLHAVAGIDKLNRDPKLLS